MAEPALPDTPPDPQRLALAWRIAPASLDFILDVRSISRRDRDLIDSLLFATIVSSNVAPLIQDPGLQLAYAGLDSPVPDGARRPVSINAVAQSMRIPFETARRRIRAMAKDGLVELTERGAIIPQSILERPEFIEGIVLRHARVGRFYRDLCALDALSPAAVAAPAVNEAPVLVTNRQTWAYILRMADEMITLTGDPMGGLILMEILQLNIETLSPDELAAWAQAPHALGKPARTAAFAAKLGLSPETTRRYVMSLADAGFCVRSKAGARAILPPDKRPALERMALDNLANVQRMFARLGQLGVLAAFDTETPAAAAASA